MAITRSGRLIRWMKFNYDKVSRGLVQGDIKGSLSGTRSLMRMYGDVGVFLSPDLGKRSLTTLKKLAPENK